MMCRDDDNSKNAGRPGLANFRSEVVDRIRRSGDVWELPGGQLLIPKAFGFCRGVTRALAMLSQAVREHASDERLFLLGQIIHNPWVNEYFQQKGVRILLGRELENLEQLVGPEDCCVIPAFGIPLPLEQRLRAIGCEIVDTSCGDVRRLWAWAQRAAGEGFGVLIFGRANHDETVVTKSRLDAAGGKYVVVGDLGQAAHFCEMIVADAGPEAFREVFNAAATNADSLEPFLRLAQVSQTTMLYSETMQVQEMLSTAFTERFGPTALDERLMLQPTVCRATQDRQTSAVDLCKSRPDLVVVVGGFESSNTRHLFELARQYAPAVFIETADAIRSEHEIESFDPAGQRAGVIRDWLPSRRPLRIAVLAGASSPEFVVGQVLTKLAAFLS